MNLVACGSSLIRLHEVCQSPRPKGINPTIESYKKPNIHISTIDNITLVGHVKMPKAEALRLEFVQQSSTEKRNDPHIIMTE